MNSSMQPSVCMRCRHCRCRQYLAGPTGLNAIFAYHIAAIRDKTVGDVIGSVSGCVSESLTLVRRQPGPGTLRAFAHANLSQK